MPEENPFLGYEWFQKNPVKQKGEKPEPDRRGLTRKDVGRHDWTRTNDPYHVKVVL